MTVEISALTTLAVIGILGIACQWLSWWLRLPAILLLLLTGILAGPVTGLINPDALFGELLFPLVSLSVAIILFEGSLTLKFEEIRGLHKVVRNLISIGAIITWLTTATAAHYLLDFSVEIALLFGAVVVVTGPTVIIPMLRVVRPNADIANILRWEGIVIDPLGALLSVLVFEFIISSQLGDALGHVFMTFGRIVFTGIVMGMVFAHILGFVLRRHLIPEYLRNVLVLTLVFGVYAVSDMVEHESGLLAVTVMGIALANMKNTDISEILDFKESLSVLLISGLFIILAARIEGDILLNMGSPALLLLAAILFVSRPLAVFVSTLGSDLNLREKFMIAWIGPRGIVAAAISAVFALRLEEAGMQGAELLVPVTFLVIIGTVVIQSTTAKYLAGWLGVQEPPPRGVLITGAGIVSRVIGKALQEQGFKVLLTDSNWENITLARQEGLDTYYGNPVSEHADRNLVLVGIGNLLGMSGSTHLDSLAAQKYKSEFGARYVYELISARDRNIPEKHQVSSHHRGRPLFAKDINHADFAGWLRTGASIDTVELTEDLDFQSYLNRHEEHCVPLFAVDPKEELYFFTVDEELTPEAGWKVTCLILPEHETYRLEKDEEDEESV